MKHPTHCERCARRYRNRGAWNCVFRAGACIALLCPRCQTPEENAEAEINEATLDYFVLPNGRVAASAKAVA